jgi:hypothetical protein
MSSKSSKWPWSVTPGGVEHTTLGTSINVSSNGTSTVSSSNEQLAKVVFKLFEEMNAPGEQAAADVDHEANTVANE